MLSKNTIFRNYFLMAGVLSVVSIIGIFVVRNYLPPLLPLFYGKPVGMEELAPKDFIFLVPLGSFAVSFVNLFISRSVKDEFVKKILAVSSFVVAFMSTVTVVKIILLIGFF